MKKSRDSEEQIVRLWRETDKAPLAQVAKRHGVSEQSVYDWRKRYGEFDVDEVRHLMDLEAESTRLRKMLVDRDLELKIMKEISKREW